MLISKKGTTHKHTFETRYKLDRPDSHRPAWAGDYDKGKRWLVFDYCTTCHQVIARDITYHNPED